MMNKCLTVFAVLVLASGLILSNASMAMSKHREASSAQFRTTQIIGADVHDQNGKKFGEIRDLVMDPQVPGRILFAIVKPGRSLEFSGERLIAIPFSALSRRNSEHYVLHMSRDMIRRAPSFDEDHWPDLADRSWSAEVYRFFGQTPYWTEEK